MNLFKKITTYLLKIHPKATILKVPKGHRGQIATNLNHLTKKGEELLLKGNLAIKKIEKVGNFLNLYFDYREIKHNRPEINIKKTNLEYCSPNPTGPLHLGHLAGIVFGKVLDNLYKLLKLPVKSEIYINNLGEQMKQFRQSVKAVKEGKEPEVYKSKMVYKWAKYDKDPIKLQTESIFKTLKKLGITFENTQYESNQGKYFPRILQLLKEKNRIYQGKIPNQQSSGEVIAYVDEKEKYHVLQRSNGNLTYYALDLCYSFNKKERGFQSQICILGEDHKGHVQRMTSALRILGIEYIGVYYGLLKFKRDNQVIIFSKRSGNTINIKDLKLDFSQIVPVILSKKSKKDMICNVENFFENSRAKEMLLLENKMENMLELLENKIEYISEIDAIIKDIIFFPKILKDTIEKKDPHIIFDNAYKFSQNCWSLFNKYSIIELKNILPKQLLQEMFLVLRDYNKVLYS